MPRRAASRRSSSRRIFRRLAETNSVKTPGCGLDDYCGKISAGQIRALLDAYQSDANRDHMVMPGMVHRSHPTEYGTLYSRAELAEISALCRSRGIPLYLDRARLAYALACPQNDVTLADIAAL